MLERNMDMKLFLKNKTIFILDDKINYWDNFNFNQYDKYLKAKMLYKLKNINYN